MSVFFKIIGIFIAVTNINAEVVESLAINKSGVKLELSRTKNCDDCGLYSSIEIKFPNGESKKFDSPFGDRLTSSAMDEGGEKLGRYLRLYSVSEDNVLVLSQSMKAPQGDFRVFQVKGNSAKEIFTKESFTFHKIVDFNKDGIPDLLNEGGKGEPRIDNTHFSYDPYIVFKGMTKDQWIRFSLDIDSSKKWSSKNDFKWHGQKYDASLFVDKKGVLHQ